MADQCPPRESVPAAESPRTQTQADDDPLQAARLESMRQLAASVAHEYNNVLTVILSCGHALSKAAERGLPTPADDVRQFVDATERAAALTRSLLAFARRQGGEPVPLDLNRVIERARETLAGLLGEGIRLELQLAPGLWAIQADPAQLEQVLRCLIANARDALSQGGRVCVTTENAPAGSGAVDEVRLELSDDGVGMAPEVRARAFDPFFTTKRKGCGTGLGLAVVHGIVSQSGGQVRLDSAPGQGTRVRLRFPRTEALPADGAGTKSVPRETAGGTEAILLVEDDPGVRRQTLRALAGAGYHVHVACDGEEALALAGTLALVPDLLLTDVVMPRLDGPQLAARLRARWPALRTLFTSGYTDERLVSPEAAEGEFMAKPFTVAQLLSRVREALDAPPRAD